MNHKFNGISLLGNLDEIDTDKLSIQNRQTITPDVAQKYDFLLCSRKDRESLLQSGHMTPFIIVVDEEVKNSQEEPSVFDAWVLNDEALEQNIYEVCIQSKKEIERVKVLQQNSNDASQCDFVSQINIQNLDLIKSKMQHSTNEIRQIFKNEIDNMRSVYEDLELTKKTLASYSQEEGAALKQSVVQTEDILNRTADVIKNMHGFVSILQCEDRITQMIDGIIAVTQKHLTTQQEIPQETKQQLIESMLACYTIQEQRDMLIGKEVDKDGCENSEEEEEEFTLF